MGEEENKEAEEKNLEERKKVAEEGEKEEAPPKANDEGKKDEKKSEEQPPPPPPQEIVLKVFMHCEGCARKVRRCLKGFEGVEDVIADCRTCRVVVKGERADPVRVLERVQRKSHRKVELISPIPKPPPNSQEKTQVVQEQKQEVVKPDEKKEEGPLVITVVLGVYMHCHACAQEIKRRIQRMKGVESAEPDLKSSQVIVKGVFEPQKLADYVYKRTGKHAVIVKVEPEKKEEEQAREGKEAKEEKKAEEGVKEATKEEEAAKENKEDGGDGAAASGGGSGEPPTEPEADMELEEPKLELRKKEFYYYYPQYYEMYHPRFVQEMNAYPPQIFSDENPNACSVM